MSPLPAAIRAVLADHEWHDREEIQERVASLVPPGQAVRAAERERESRRAKEPPKNEHARRARVPHFAKRGDPVVVGARVIVTRVLLVMERRGKIERHPDDRSRYRLTA